MNNDAVVYVVDDDAAVRSGIALLLRSAGLQACAFESAAAFIDAYSPGICACLLLDVRLPNVSGLELQEWLRQKHIELPVIMITGHGDVPMAVRAMRHGAVDFLEKPFNEQLLLERVHQALKLDRDRLVASAAKHGAASLYEQLSPREREVMQGIVSGKANKVIAIELGISERTVEVHRRRVMGKMRVQSLAELVQLSLRLN